MSSADGSKRTAGLPAGASNPRPAYGPPPSCLLRCFRPKAEKPEDRPPTDDPGNSTVSFHGERRSNESRQSTTDPEARLMRKEPGKEA
ncbi:MAG TPA: hypothetical protein VFC51_12195 [Chloroflexota bacterium]|nr:hypothetical protein [Chloroflexota bacterium]